MSISIMDTLFNQEIVFERYLNEVRREAAEKAARNIALKMIEMGMDNDQISRATGFSVEEVENLRETMDLMDKGNDCKKDTEKREIGFLSDDFISISSDFDD